MRSRCGQAPPLAAGRPLPLAWPLPLRKGEGTGRGRRCVHACMQRHARNVPIPCPALPPPPPPPFFSMRAPPVGTCMICTDETPPPPFLSRPSFPIERTPPTHPPSRPFSNAAACADLGRPIEAIACFESALAARPWFPDAFCNLVHTRQVRPPRHAPITPTPFPSLHTYPPLAPHLPPTPGGRPAAPT